VKKLCYVATIPAVVHAFLRPHIVECSKVFDVTVICNSTEKHLLEGLPARIIYVPIERKPSVLKDLRVLLLIIQLFRKERFDIVHSIMPKTGVLAMFAAWLCSVPVRIHTFTGQVWSTQSGIQRGLLKQLDAMLARFATCILADSPSQRDFLVSEGVLASGKAHVIGAGSICGVDTLRFHPNSRQGAIARSELGIPQSACVILFVGRLNRDKGMLDLSAAFDAVAKRHETAVLLLVGAEEDVPYRRITEICHAVRDRIHYIPFTSTPERYMAAADIFCLPSYREGFGMTIIEAAACAVPAVASRIYGVTDAVEDGKTGLLFKAGDLQNLTQLLCNLLTDSSLRQTMGRAAKSRVLDLFLGEKITQEMLFLYGRLAKGN
jgi:glycosyltransferase involved in cell wall biosynthesis